MKEKGKRLKEKGKRLKEKGKRLKEKGKRLKEKGSGSKGKALKAELAADTRRRTRTHRGLRLEAKKGERTKDKG